MNILQFHAQPFLFNKSDVQHNSDTVNTVNSSLDVRNGVLVNIKRTCSIRSIFTLNNRWNVEWNFISIHNYSMEWARPEYCLAFHIHLIIPPFNTEDLPSAKPLTYNWKMLLAHCNVTLRQVNIIVTHFDSLSPRINNNINEAESKSVGRFNLPYYDQLWLNWIVRSMMRHNSVQR